MTILKACPTFVGSMLIKNETNFVHTLKLETPKSTRTYCTCLHGLVLKSVCSIENGNFKKSQLCLDSCNSFYHNSTNICVSMELWCVAKYWQYDIGWFRKNSQRSQKSCQKWSRKNEAIARADVNDEKQ